jgi:hypothetical protein
LQDEILKQEGRIMVPRSASMMDAHRALPPLLQDNVVEQEKKLIEIDDL